MSLRLTLLLAASLSLSACATVDLNEMASPSATPAAKTADVNVVQRAASKLYTAFANRGFVPKSSRKKMQSAARVLVFEDALIKTSGEARAMDYKAYKTSVNELRDVTNAFGDRVREAQMTKVAEIN